MKSVLFSSFILILALIIPFQGKSQSHSVGVHYELPLKYGIQYTYRGNKSLGGYAEIGYLSDPNSQIVLVTIESLGASSSIVNLIENAFSSGWVYEGGITYDLNDQWYLGAFGQYFILTGEETSVDLIESVLGIDISNLPPRINAPEETELTLNSDLFQTGVLVGYRKPISDRSTIALEFSFSLHVTSTSSLESETRNVNNASLALDELLANTYSSYAYIPSVNIRWDVRLGN